jgi:hypothetical protein
VQRLPSGRWIVRSNSDDPCPRIEIVAVVENKLAAAQRDYPAGAGFF